jgi:hypothetical protein
MKKKHVCGTIQLKYRPTLENNVVYRNTMGICVGVEHCIHSFLTVEGSGIVSYHDVLSYIINLINRDIHEGYDVRSIMRDIAGQWGVIL